jgi:hypothetical protein
MLVFETGPAILLIGDVQRSYLFGTGFALVSNNLLWARG